MTNKKKVVNHERVINTANDVNHKGHKQLFKLSGPKKPILYFTAKAWHQIFTIVPLASQMKCEVTWYHPIIEETLADGTLTLTVPEIFVPEQIVSQAACDDVDWAIPLNEAFDKGYNPDTMKGWSHLHPSASVAPSATDHEQTQDLLDNWDTLLRCIFNAQGGYKADFFDARTNSIFEGLHINIIYPEDFETDKMREDFKARVKKAPPIAASTRCHYYPDPKTFVGSQNSSQKKK